MNFYRKKWILKKNEIENSKRKKIKLNNKE